jgi:hypothetical protein
MTPLGVKTCGESEFDIFEANKRFPDSEKCIEAKSRKNAIFYDFNTQAFPIREAFFRFENFKFEFPHKNTNYQID